MTPPLLLPTDSLGELVRRERGALAHVARREGMSPEEACECVQDALCTYLSLELSERADDGHAIATLKTIVRNTARNARRKHARARRHDPLDAVDVEGDADPADAQLDRAEQLARLRGCVAELAEVQRSVITLRLLDERSGEDVAATLGLSRGYVDVLVHRARQALSDCMMCV